jgi:hypothetical protein
MYLNNRQFQQETTHINKLSAQALVITLLVLSIISIVVTGVVVVSRRDINQVVNNEKYERLFNESESKVRETVQTYGITSIPATCSAPAILPGSSSYSCGTTNLTTDQLNSRVDLNIVDKKSFEDFSVSKDRTLDVALNGYSGEIQVRWNKLLAMEFAIIYTDAGGNIQTIRDVYDMANVYNSLIGDDPNSDTGNIHDINFQILDSGAISTTTKFTISATNGISLGSTLSLRITPRSKTASDIVSLTVKASDESSFPFQVREFISNSLDPADTGSPLASVVAKVPLNPQIDDIFDYTLLVNGNLIQ